MAIKMKRKCKKKEEISINSSHFNFSYFSYFSFQRAIMGVHIKRQKGNPSAFFYKYYLSISFSGFITKSRSSIKGWGTCRSGSLITKSSIIRISMSMMRS